MFYSVETALYDELLARLTDAISDAGYFSGSLTFDFGDAVCRLTASLIVARRTERQPEGTCRPIADLIPVWWEFHTLLADGEVLNDFSFDTLRSRL